MDANKVAIDYDELIEAVNYLERLAVSEKKVRDFFPHLSKIALLVRSKVEASDPDLLSTEVKNSIIILCNRISDMLRNSNWNNSLIDQIHEEISILLTKIPLIMPKSSINEQHLNQYLEKIESDAEKNYSNTSTKLTDLIVKANEKVLELENLEVQGKKLTQILSGKTINNDFQKRANSEWWGALVWTLVTIALIIGTIVALYLILKFQLQQPPLLENAKPDFQLLATKFLIIVTLGLAAKWTSKRANRHLLEESKYHRLAVNIETIKTYTESLEPETKDKVLAEFALKIFTDGSGNDTSTDYDSSSSDVVKEFIGKLIK